MSVPAKLLVSVIIVQDDKVLMIQEGKHNNTWNFPAGHIELGEEISQSARREFKEETGLGVDLDGIVGIMKHDFLEIQGLIVFLSGRVNDDLPVEREANTVDMRFISREELETLDLRYVEVYDAAQLALDGQKFPLSMLMSESDVMKMEEEI
jgi:8-oxo-dGTP pyrophosphatase MutT (NUDIX family)